MAKRSLAGDGSNAKRVKIDQVLNFWEENYRYGGDYLERLSIGDVLALFRKVDIGKDITEHDFTSLTSRVGVKSKRNKRKRFYLAQPYSKKAIEHHRALKDASNVNERQSMQFHLLNIQGFITNSKNKGQYLNTVTNTCPKIIVVTETHLNKKKLHDDAEVKLGFKDYNLHRADRDTEFDLDDEYQLSSHGGCLILTSPMLVSEKKLEFSNGNCELVIVEVPQLESYVIGIYKPPPPNYSLRKFKEIIVKVRQFLIEREKQEYKIVMAGDFNFPSHVVEWIDSEEGVFPFPKEGRTDEKVGFGFMCRI